MRYVKWLTLMLTTIVLSGCLKDNQITPAEYQRASQYCEPNGGLHYIDVYEYNHYAYCHNGMEVKLPVHRDKPLAKTTAK